MKVIFTKPFVRDYHKKLSKEAQQQFDKQLQFLLTNFRHPSLQVRIIDPRRRIWKAKVDGGYRFTFEIKEDVLTLRAIGAYDEMERPSRW
jgi:mRNA-degrading endonuclease RelE of RelBE toxin-antitoxin system